MKMTDVEIGNISQHGLWVLVKRREYFMPFEKFPWFEHATVKQIMDVQLLHRNHLYWAQLDVDLELECLEHPDEYPLIAHDEKTA